MQPELDIGVPGGQQLLNFADAITGSDPRKLDEARTALSDELGPASVVAASATVATFTKNDRIANSLGIPVDPLVLDTTKEVRGKLGLNDFGSAINTFRHSH